MKALKDIKFINNMYVIYIILIGLKLVQTMVAFKTGYGGAYVPWMFLAEGVAVALVVKPVIMRKRWALWAMGIYLLLQGSGGVFLLFLAPVHQGFLKMVGFMLGIVFLVGGLVLLRQAKGYPGTV